MGDRSEKYKPNELPSELSRKVYLHYKIAGYCAGQINVWDWDKATDDESIVLCGCDVTLKLPKISHKGLKQKALETLEEQKRKVLAENHERLKTVQDKIDNLLAIEYKPTK